MQVIRNNPLLTLLVLFFSALAVRLVYLIELSGNPLFDTILIGLDHFNFDQAAINFSRGDWLASSPNNNYAPLYKYFLGVLYWLFGRNFHVVYGIQFLMGAFGSVLVYLIARDLFGIRAGLIAFAGFAFYSTEIIYEGIILRAAFITFWGLVSFYLLMCLERKCSNPRLIAATLALSMFIQARPNTLLVLPFVCVYLHQFVFNSMDRRLQIRHWMLFLGTLVLSFIPLLLQCYLVHGRFVLFDASGPNAFLVGNQVTYPGVGYDSRLAEPFRGIHGPAAVIGVLWDQILADPFGFVQMYLRKIFFFLNDFEAPSNLSVYLYRESSGVLPYLLNHFALYSSLGLMGIAVSLYRRKHLFLLHSFTLALVLSVVLFHVVARFRVPVAPFFIIFSGYALNEIIHWLEKRQYVPAAGAIMVSLVFLFGFRSPDGVLPIRHVDHCNMGLSYLNNREKFDLNKVEMEALKCRAIEGKSNIDLPDSRGLLTMVYNLYGQHLVQEGRLQEAENVLQRSRRIFPFDVAAYHQLSNALANDNQNAKALRILQKGIAVSPRDRDLFKKLVDLHHRNQDEPARVFAPMVHWAAYENDPQMIQSLKQELVRLQQQMVAEKRLYGDRIRKARESLAREDWRAAIAYYNKVNRVNGTDAELFLEQGVALGRIQQLEDSLTALYQGLTIDPTQPEIHRILGDYYDVVNLPVEALVHWTRYLEHPMAVDDNDRRNKRDALRLELAREDLKPVIPSLNPPDNRAVWALLARSVTKPADIP